MTTKKKTVQKNNDNTSATTDGERIAKRMARAGLCSRRDAEKWIEAGRVSVNGKIITSAALNVVASDTIMVDGKQLPKKEEAGLWMYHKPVGVVCSDKDDQGRPTIFDAMKMPAGITRLMYVGRLDLNSEGLLLLTNDGDLKRYLELPKTGLERTYRARVFGDLDYKRLDELKNGCVVEGVRYGPVIIEIEKEEATGRNHWLIVTLTEGKNREVRNVLRSLDLHVNRLIRQQYGTFKLGKLERGDVFKAPHDKIERLLKDMEASNPSKKKPTAAGKSVGKKPVAAKPSNTKYTVEKLKH